MLFSCSNSAIITIAAIIAVKAVVIIVAEEQHLSTIVALEHSIEVYYCY